MSTSYFQFKQLPWHHDKLFPCAKKQGDNFLVMLFKQQGLNVFASNFEDQPLYVTSLQAWMPKLSAGIS